MKSFWKISGNQRITFCYDDEFCVFTCQKRFKSSSLHIKSQRYMVYIIPILGFSPPFPSIFYSNILEFPLIFQIFLLQNIFYYKIHNYLFQLPFLTLDLSFYVSKIQNLSGLKIMFETRTFINPLEPLYIQLIL